MADRRASSRLDLDTLRAAYRSGAPTPEQLIDGLYARLTREQPSGVWITRRWCESVLRVNGPPRAALSDSFYDQLSRAWKAQKREPVHAYGKHKWRTTS